MDQLFERAAGLLRGGYDLHAHSAPSHIQRSVDDFGLLEQASAADMSGILIKNHYESTAGRAALLNRMGGLKTKAYGGLVLNWPAGGINPYAAESALRMGASFVWLPTRDAAHCLDYGNMPGDFFDRPGIRVLDQDGKPVKALLDVMEVVKKYGAVLATGHISPREAQTVCLAARAMGVKTVLTHPDWNRLKIPVDVQCRLAKAGVLIEKNWANVDDGDCSEQEMLLGIRQVGPEHIFISTDRGQHGKGSPVDGMLRFIAFLLKNGFSEGEISKMVRGNPARLLNEPDEI